MHRYQPVVLTLLLCVYAFPKHALVSGEGEEWGQAVSEVCVNSVRSVWQKVYREPRPP